ncbi:hypothetical protein SETIT_1G117700v2 [Setaria italica]|uniref:F-box domain-containing protein n=2 Tax=Setaria italica TaxID=4555 RepID=A0A368PK66_SETIT|nr:hypothetical protein SETIT_1G117700v2 [Setaria italica]
MCNAMKLQKTGMKRKKGSIPRRRTPELSEEILARLPVKSLVRCKSVCKAWRATISDPVFIRAWEQDPSVIITLDTLDYLIPGERWPSTFSNHVRFYQWQPSNGQAAKFLHAKDFSGDFSRLCYFTHCDGLLYLFNPATRDAITLPDSRNNPMREEEEACHCSGLDLDPRTGRYKVVQAFFRSIDADANIYRMGMEVFTVSGGAWRETPDDLPCPIKRWQAGLIPSKGFCSGASTSLATTSNRLHGVASSALTWRTNRSASPRCRTGIGDACLIDELRGELCLTAPTGGTPATMTVWAMAIDDDGRHGQWERRYSYHFPRLCHPMGLLPGGQVLLWNQLDLYSYEAPSSELKVLCEMGCMRARRWKKLWNVNVRPYTESLVRITA